MIFANLLRDVIRTGKCVYCGHCSAACPTLAVQMLEDVPRILGICIKCGYCYYSCPETSEDEFPGFEGYEDKIDERIFGEKRKNRFGVFKRVYVVKTLDDPSSFPDEAVLKKILAYGLRKGYWDVVVYPGRDEPVTNGLLNYNVSGWRGRPSIAFKPEVIENARLKLITPGPTILGVRGAIEELKGSYFHGSDPVRVAVLGPPQHIKSIWKGRFSWAGHRKLLRNIVFTVSYFKRPFYLPSKLNLILSKNGLSLDNITDLRLEKDRVVFISGDRVLELKYADLKEAEHPGISSDPDITGEYADLSAGSLDGVDGVILIARSEEASKLLNEIFEEGLLEEIKVSEEDVLAKLNSLYEVN